MTSFRLPLKSKEFREAMERGLGRALMHVREYGLGSVREEFLRAWLVNLVHDTQCEGSRTRWLGEFFEGVPEWLLTPLQSSYGTVDEERDLFQIAELLGLLAGRNNETAKKTLYDGFRKTEWGYLGSEELLELDGSVGLLWIAEKLGQEDGLERQDVDALLADYDTLHGGGEGLKVLKGSSKPAVQRVVRAVLEYGEKFSGPKQRGRRLQELTVEEFLAEVQGKALMGLPGAWARTAPPEDLRVVARALKTTENPETLQSLLRCFQRSGLPEFWEGLLALAHHEERDVRWLTYWVLRHHVHPGIRALGLQRLEENRILEGEFKLFQCNFKKGDAKRILAALRRLRSEDRDVYHWALDDVLDVATANPIQETLALLVFVYQHTPCTNCRRKAVLAMRERGELPNWILEECRYDCDFELRGELKSVQADGAALPGTS